MIVRNSMLLAFFGGLSILLGVVRDRLLSEYVGVGPMLDVYNAAFRIPDWTLAIMLSFASATTVVPFIIKAVQQEDMQDLRRRFSSLFIFFGGAMLVLGGIVVALLPFVAHFIVPGFSVEQTHLFIYATSLLMVQPLLLGLSTLISSLAQVKHQFMVYSLAPLFYTATIIYSVTMYPVYGFKVLVYGVILGAVFHIAVQSYTLIRQGLGIDLSLFDVKLVKEHIIFAGPRSGSYIISRTRDIVFTSVATTFGPGALTIYVFAQRVIDAYMQIIVQSISTASLPKLAAHHAEGNTAHFSNLVKKSILYILFFSCGMTLTIFLFKEPLLRILYGVNAPIESIGSILMLLGIGLPLLAINFYFTSAFNASKNNVALFVSNLAATTCAIFGLFLMKVNGIGLNSLGFANIIISIVYLTFLVYFYLKGTKENISH